MSEKKKAQELECAAKGISRRSFLRDAGLAAAVPAVAPIALGGDASSPRRETGAGDGPERAGAECACPGEVELTVNGERYHCTVEPHWSLRQLLRDQVGYTSPKDWCGGQGACGSCTVIVDGRPVLSCLTLACECHGTVVETAEGIAKEKHPLVEAYIEHNAFQCGYCTPGFVCTAKALLDRNPNPTEADVRDALGGNLCRCGTYQQHPPAVIAAAEELRRDRSRS
ncbi:MAG: (2Fe-2S)-binding protein [Acidobacteria bacterium]|nr:(2Fe-2S)-binding protein [Acidobacteriota bacterium]